MLVILKNISFRRIGPIDSIAFQFYRYNINLKQPIYYSNLGSKNMTVTGVSYEKPVTFFSKKYVKQLVIKSGQKYKIEIALSNLADAVRVFGNEDNRLQAKTEFQIFSVGFKKGKMVFHLPSSFFKIE